MPDAAAQSTGTVEGRVVDANDGTPLPGANVAVEGTSTGTSTDEDGRYALSGVPTGSQTIRVSFVGYEKAEKTLEVRSGETTSLNVKLKSQITEAGEVVVTGIRKNQMRSINQKRQAANVIDVLSADEIGNLPEQNVAEAVQRLPGISIQTSRGEGRLVTIRGAQPDLNNVTMNGHSFASTAERRATALDLVPSEMVSSVEVIKAVRPDMDANAVGGTININTLSAFDRDGTFVSASGRLLNHAQQLDFEDKRQPFRASVTAGTQFGADQQWGIAVSASAFRRDFTTAEFNPATWNDVDGTMIPEDLETNVEDHNRDRYSVNTNLDYRFTSTSRLYARGYYSHTAEVERNNEYEFYLTDGDGEIVNQTPTSAEFLSSEAELDLGHDDEKESLYSITLGSEQRFGAVQWDASGTFTRGILDRTDHDVEFGSRDDELFGVYFDANREFSTIYPTNPEAVRDPSNYFFNSIDRETQSNDERTWVASTDVRWDVDVFEQPAYWKTGLKLQSRNKVIDDLEEQWNDGETPVSMGQFAMSTLGPIHGGIESYVMGDVDRFVDYFYDNINDGSRFDFDEQELIEEEHENDSRNQEDIYAGYVMGNIEVGAFTVLGGARLEHTRTDARRSVLIYDDDADTITPDEETFSNAYTNVLPSLHLRYSATDNLLFRAAWTNTIGRPDYDETAGFREVYFNQVPNEPGVFEGGVNESNPNLSPYRAMNTDITAEYYTNQGGLIAVAGFYKHVDNPIYEEEFEYNDVERLNRFFREFEYSQQRNADAGSVLGLEVTFQQPFTFLPAPLNGLGLSSNTTVSRSSVEVPGREEDELPFFGQSDLIYNIEPYFQKAGFEVRLAWHYRSEYLDNVGGDPMYDEYEDERRTIDVSASYDVPASALPSQWTLQAQVRNLTNEPERGYQRERRYPTAHTLSGRTVSFGMTTNF
jgi:TonB-dependent receptor